MNPMIGYAMRTATFGLIGFFMSQIAAAAVLLTLDRLVDGEVLGLLFALPAAASLTIALHALREVADGLRSV
jgi:hypothetical protein